MLSYWHRLQEFATGPQLPWVILWLGLAVLIVGLIVLARTSWGQSHPLQKCAALSLLVHLLFAAYATTVEIVTAGSPDGHTSAGSINVTLVDDSAENGGREAAVWNRLTTGVGPLLPPAAELSRSESPPSLASQKPELARETIDAASGPSAGQSSADLAAQITPSADASASRSKAAAAKMLTTDAAAHVRSAATIDATIAPQAALSAEIEPSALSPDRQSLAPAAMSGPAAAAAAIASISPSPPTADSILAPDSPDGTTHGDSLRGNPADDAKHQINSGANGTNSAGNSPNRSSAGSVDQAWKSIAVGPAHLSPIDIGTAPDAGSIPGGNRTSTARSMAPAAPPKIYQDRLSNNRPALLQQRGGSAETEAAVQKALKWLALVQEPNGRFDAEKYGAGRETVALGHNRSGAGTRSDTGITGLALLAMLGSGNTHLHGPYARNVQHGLEWLLSVQAPDGNLGGQATTFSFMYCHGMATFAMSEDYAMTHDPRLEQPLRRAIAYTIAAQHPVTGGWRYLPHEMGDTSQLGWQLMALKSAELAGMPMPEQTRDGAIRFLKSVASGTSGGLSSYRPGELPTRTMTAEALVCRQFLGMARDNPAADEAAKSLLAELPSKENVNPYYWYYGTLGMYQLQGEYWQRWNEALQAALISRQQADGELAGSWDPVCVWDGYGGRIYSTAMSALCLEVYYRFLPLYKEQPLPAPQAAATAAAPAATSDR